MSYLIRARLICHDVRLNTWVQAITWLESPPTIEQAKKLLWPVGDTVVAENFCQDCPYELSEITISALPGA